MANKNIRTLSSRKELDENLFENIAKTSQKENAKEELQELAITFMVDDSVVFGTSTFYDFTRETNKNKKVHVCSGTMTRETDNQKLLSKDVLEVDPKDAIRKGIEDNEIVRIFSDRGSVNIPIKYSKNVKRGVLRTTFHQPEVFINIITGSVGDKETMTPEYKVVAVDFARI